MRADFAQCPVCLYEKGSASYRPDGVDAVIVDCPRCGKFELSGTLASTDFDLNYGPRWLLSSAIRNRYEAQENVTLYTSTVEELIKSIRPPSDPFKSIELLVRHIHRKADGPDKGVFIDVNSDYPLFYARDVDELVYYIEKAKELGMIEGGYDPAGFRLGLEGWRWVLNLGNSEIKTDKAFVAMWFDAAMTPAFAEGFAPALEDCGYDPMRIDLYEHNDKIDDMIVSEIRRSGLLIADFTGHRGGGVYFEAGFALGLGIPVIWTCRSDEIDDVHFDTRQYNHVVWEDPKDLREKLTRRIQATYPRPS